MFCITDAAFSCFGLFGGGGEFFKCAFFYSFVRIGKRCCSRWSGIVF